MNIALMKEMTGLLVKEITPALHKLQAAFFIFEDQPDGEWDRSWMRFEEMFPNVDVERYSRQEALRIVLRRFAYRYVYFTAMEAKSFYGLPEKGDCAGGTGARAGGCVYSRWRRLAARL